MRPPIVEHALIDGVLEAHRAVLGADFDGYRHHVYRVASFFDALGPARFDASPALPVAAAFHDLGIWVAGTFDYLDPSVALAERFIADEGLDEVDSALVRELILQHHKLRAYREGPHAAWVEQWRRADHVDVSLGLLRFGLPGRQIRLIQRRLPDRGFHARLLQLTLKQWVRHPLRPLPMMKW